jgi:protein-L-isoaspartate(D-aspartate) O-methyltransferase
MNDLNAARVAMVDDHLARRGIKEPHILNAFRAVARSAFVPSELEEFAYEDTPLPIGKGQTISQPYIVALTIQALRLTGSERVLEIGTGCGYAAAVLSRVAREVYTVERIPELAKEARERLASLGYGNVHVLHADGSLGWPEHAPYDAIAVAASGPRVPQALLDQLRPGGRLVMPVGPSDDLQTLVRVTRRDESRFDQEELTDVRFVPLIGEQGFPGRAQRRVPAPPAARTTSALSTLVREDAERLSGVETGAIDALLARASEARVVLLGEATHGTSEFYRMRSRVTRELITKHGFQFVAVEADWPDAARVDEYVLGEKRRSTHEFKPFARFPTWMWRNSDVDDFASWLRAYNLEHPRQKAGFHGLDLYSLFTSIALVLAYLDDVDPDTARVARRRYGSLTPWQSNPAAYGKAVLAGRYRSSEEAVVAMLRDVLARRIDYAAKDGERFFDAAQNARLVANAERYYRAMYYGSAASWNLRDSHMFDTLRSLLRFYGEDSKAVVWAHNSHIGNARATAMSHRGEHNLGQLCKDELGIHAYSIGFGTDHGTVTAAQGWEEPAEFMHVVPAHRDSYERMFHDSDVKAFCLPLRDPRREALLEELIPERLERAIGVVYRPDSELLSHYFYASLPRQFDEYIWFDETHAVTPLPKAPVAPALDLPETYPFGL